MAAAMALTAAASYARADAVPLARLQYTRASGAERCPSEEAFRRDVIERMGFDPFAVDRPTLVSVRFERDRSQLRVIIHLTDLSTQQAIGHRELHSGNVDCVELAANAALAVTIAIDTLGEQQASEPSTTREETPTAAPRVQASASDAEVPWSEPAPANAEPVQQDWRYEIAAAVGAQWNALPAVAPTLQVRFGAMYGWLVLDGQAFIDPYAVTASPSGARVQALLWGGRIAACVRYKWLDGCASVGAGQIYAHADLAAGLASDNHATAFVGALVRAHVDLIDNLSLSGSVEFDIPMLRASLDVEGARIWTASWVQPRLLGGVRYQWP